MIAKRNSWQAMHFALKCVLILMLAGCTDVRPLGPPASEEQIKNTTNAVAMIRASLYTPADAVLIAEKSFIGSRDPSLWPGCAAGHAFMAFVSAQSFDHILSEYRQVLPDFGWIPDPGYSHDATTSDIFTSGQHTLLTVGKRPLYPELVPDPTLAKLSDQKMTVFYLLLEYYDPSKRQCRP